MVNSMTGFASRRGQAGETSWLWELRGMNGKGFDLRLRLPEGTEALEARVRERVARCVARGHLTLSLRLTRQDAAVAWRLNASALDAALTALRDVEMAAAARGVTVTPARSSDILALRGVLDVAAEADDPAPLHQALLDDLATVIDEYNASRAHEGKILRAVLTRQASEAARILAEISEEAESRRDHIAASLNQALARVLDAARGADPDRVAQELALLMMKSDVTEELDRMTAHLVATSALLESAEPVGRRLDFLMQELNRETNTLCAKAPTAELARLGLDLKALIDQMREQVQNVE